MLIVRRTYKELEGNHISILKSELAEVARYVSTTKTLTFVNGSVIEFMYCAKDGDLQALQGQEYDVVFLDEATNLSEYQMKAITACVRGVNDFPKRIYYTCNPGGQGHAYIKRVFIDRNFNSNENPDDYIFIQALVDDNKALMEAQPDYVAQLEALPEKLREAWRHGKWDVFEGQCFQEITDSPEHYLDRTYTHVIEPFDVPDDWTILRGFDWGYSHPFSCHWYAVDHSGVLYCIRELYGCTGEADVGVEWTVDRVAREIAAIEAQDPMLKRKHITGIADPAIWQENGGESIAETFERHRIYFQKGDHARLAGKMQCHYRLAFDDDGLPMFYVFNTCKHFIRTIPSLMYSETQVEDIDTKMEDHCLVGDTKVWTSGGLEDIKSLVGTEGYAMSSDGDYHRYHDVRLTQHNVDVYTVTLDDGSTITATPNHRFMLADGSWKRLDELCEGDELWSINCREDMKVKSIKYAGKSDVYNLEVEDTHDFAVGSGAIVHNCYDEWRYVCMSRPIPPRSKHTEKSIDINNVDDPLNMISDKYKAQSRKKHIDLI